MATPKQIDGLAAAARACLAWSIDDPVAQMTLRALGRIQAAEHIAALERIASDEFETEENRASAATHLEALPSG